MEEKRKIPLKSVINMSLLRTIYFYIAPPPVKLCLQSIIYVPLSHISELKVSSIQLPQVNWSQTLYPQPQHSPLTLTKVHPVKKKTIMYLGEHDL